jgi:hypothetical protein
VAISPENERVYDAACGLWDDLKLRCEQVPLQGVEWRVFWAAHQRCFKYLCIGIKIEECIRLAKEAVANNMAVVIGLQTTGEAQTEAHIARNGSGLKDFVSPAKEVILGLAVALSLCTTVHPLHTRFTFTNIFGASISEMIMRPNRRSSARFARSICWPTR